MNGTVRAVLFDVDGTLYHQGPLRLCMALELAALPLRVLPASARRTWGAIRAFRRVEYSIYPVISPEGCASILFRDAARAGNPGARRPRRP